MSRAFVREIDDAPPQQDERPLSPHPNYVTERGLELLRQHLRVTESGLAQPGLETEQRHHLERDLRWLQARIASAIPVDVAVQPGGCVAFGAQVDLIDVNSGERYRYALVGEDEADAAQGLLSWVSPLAVALAGSCIGDVVIWERPAGDLEVEITAVRYPPYETRH